MTMNRINEIKAMHLREMYRQMNWFSGMAVRDTYLRLSSEQRSNITQYSQQLREYMDQLGDGPVDQALLEMACLMPGAMRSKPAFMAGQSPEARPMYASELKAGREWLLRADKMISKLRKLTPKQWQLLLLREDTGVHRAQMPDATADSVLVMVEAVLPDAKDTPDGESMILDQRYCAAYAELSEAEGRELAHFALGLSGMRLPVVSMDVMEEIIAYVACFVPGALKGLHYELVQRGIFSYIGAVYSGADPETSRLLLNRLDEGGMSKRKLNTTLVALAWIGDEAVRSAFHRSQTEPPTWREQVHSSPADYAHEAGWELTASGERRSLVSEVCYPLVPSEQNQGPVSTITPGDGKCGHCGQALVTLLDLDLVDPRLSFLGIDGERLRIASCNRCGPYSEAYFTEIDLKGRSEWSSLNKRLVTKPRNDKPFYSSATRKLVLGSEPKGPLESLICWEGGSQLGGYPGWIQGADYPKCPECQQTMRFIGQLERSDFMGESSEGTTFCLVCPTYHVAATNYQQT